MCSLPDRHKEAQIRIARREVQLATGWPEPINKIPLEEDLLQPVGAFVTLHRGTRLRGCIGQLASDETLASVVAHCAKSAATQDPRFAPVRLEELPEISIEISVLPPLADAAVDQIHAGTHGIVVSRGQRRAVLLPQVARQFHWDVIRFLQETCMKAESPRDAWKEAETRIQVFTAEIFSETDFQS